MFFDYDGHTPNANDGKIKDLLQFFNEETEVGKLFISYPMVEAIKHISSTIDFEKLKVNAKENINYKGQVSNDSYDYLKDLSSLSKNNWLEIIDSHLRKMNFIVNNTSTLPTLYIPQIEIFNKQLEKYINIDSTVAVLSAFPVFLFDYYGTAQIQKFLERKYE